jgi:hypothetical protein
MPDGASGARRDEFGQASPAADPSFEVVARTSGIKDPLRAAGSSVAYGQLEAALAQAVLHSVRPRPAHTLTVELISAEAEQSQSRLSVALVARATLRAREGNTFVAQTQVVCRTSASVSAEEGGPVVWACMTRLGRDLNGWLSGLGP